MYQKKIVWILGLFVGTGFITVFMGNGCSKEFVTMDMASNLGNNTDSSVTNTIPASANVGMQIIPNTKTVSVTYSNQLLDQLTSCLGVVKSSEETESVYTEKKGTLSLYGTATTITAPMMMAITSVGASVCRDLVAQEKITQRMLIGFDYQANQIPSDNVLGQAVTNLALSCWRRRENSSERQALINMVLNSVGRQEALAGEKSAILLCTAVVSSLDSILN